MRKRISTPISSSISINENIHGNGEGKVSTEVETLEGLRDVWPEIFVSRAKDEREGEGGEGGLNSSA